MSASISRVNEHVTNYAIRNKLSDFVIPATRAMAHDRQHRINQGKDIAMSAPDSVYQAETGPRSVSPSAVSTLKWISARLVLPIVICGTIAVALQTTIAGGLKLAAADLPQLASLTTEVSSDEPAPVAPPRQSALPSHGPGDARHQAAAAMLLLLVATAKKRDGGEAQRRTARADLLPVRQTADAGLVR